MMTAEQFYETWRSAKYATPKQAWPHANHAEVCEFADAHAAAQLAEKEREIALREDEARAFKENNIKLYGELELAEQRLQEAQAQLDALKELLTDMELEHSAALRQREAELEQRWIAVGERLPEARQRVLAINGNSAVFVVSLCNNQWLSVPGNYNYHPTHWQPLPSPPK